MRKIERYIIKNWILIAVGLMLTRIAVKSCYEQRGEFYIGGEWLILPVMLVTVYLIPAIIKDFADVFGKEGDEDAGWLTENRRRMAGKGHRPFGRGGR